MTSVIAKLVPGLVGLPYNTGDWDFAYLFVLIMIVVAACIALFIISRRKRR